MAEELIGDGDAGDGEEGVAFGGELSEQIGTVDERIVDGGRDVVEFFVSMTGLDVEDRFFIDEGGRVEDDGVENAEDGRGGGDAEGEDEEGCEGEEFASP